MVIENFTSKGCVSLDNMTNGKLKAWLEEHTTIVVTSGDSDKWILDNALCHKT